MDIGRDKEELTVMEAIDNLSNMSEIDLKEPSEEEVSDAINWRNPKEALKNEEVLKETFSVIHKYLQNMVRKDPSILEDPQAQKGIQAVILLASEAVDKMDRYVAIHTKQQKPISKLKEYTDLQKYYHQQILRQMSQPSEIPEEWENELRQDFAGVEEEKRGLKNLEAVRKDQSYELFFIKNENGKMYFGPGLLRHIRLLGNFDELISKAEGEDPLLRLREMLDYELHEGAKEVLRHVAPFLDEFYKEGMQHKDRPFEGSLNKAIMGLRMAANPKNLIENQSFKSCLEYYGDFHRFLREAVKAPRYKKRISGELQEDPFTHKVLRLTHALCCYFFMRIEPRKEALKLIHQMMERGDEMLKPRIKPKAKEKKLQIWTDLVYEDEGLRYLAKHYPNGPLMRTLDMFREEEEYEGFDPLMHQNFPSQLFTFTQKGLHISVLRIPCPTKQIYIQNAEIVEEFTGFLRFLKNELKPDKHLMINLQDRTTWEEFARCRALENFGKSAEHHKTFYVLGIPKGTPFYDQRQEYQSMSGFPVFIEQFKQQILNAEDCGYSFPLEISGKEWGNFLDQVLKVVHEVFFDKKEILAHVERLNFIEIVYILLILKILEHLEVDSISFTCKDAIDVGMQQTALFYGFLHMVSDKSLWRNVEKDQLLWILYSPALLIRERVIEETRFKRAIMALETIHEQCIKKHEEIIKALNSLYKKIQFPLKINYFHTK